MNLLNGVKILSFNHYLAGPLAAQTLADLGADVIAVEPIEGAFQRNWAVANHFVAGDSVNHLATGRNKRSLAVDLKHPDGIALVKKLAATADVVMENFRPGTMAKLGLGYDTLKQINPSLIYAAATGFGSGGPYKDRPGQDLLLQALSGLAMRTGRADGEPTAVGAVIVDQHAASLYAMSILAALFARTKTGAGQLVEVNLYQAALDLQAEPLTAWLNGAPSPTSRGPLGIAAWFSPGPYGIHRTADGFVAISIASPKAPAALDSDELRQFNEADSFSRREDITRLVAARLKQRPTSVWLPVLEAARIWHAPVQDYADLQADPQLKHLGSFKTVAGARGAPVTMVMHPARYDGRSPEIRLPPQPLGAQTREILQEAGYATADIAAMIDAKVISRAMIDFSLPDDTRLLVDTVHRFVETEVQPLEEEVDRTATVPAAALKVVKTKAQELGFYAMNMPAAVGGGGLSCVEHCLVEEEFGKTSDALIRRVFGQVYPMLMACRGEQIEKYLLPTVKGDKICAMAITEPGAGSDAAAISTTAHRDGDAWVLNGTKHFISDGDIADYVILMALTDKEKRARGGITLFLVDRGTPGFAVARTQPMMGHRGYGHAELTFDQCRLPADAVLGEVGSGFKLIMQSVLQIRLAHIGARAVGMAQRALDMMRKHAAERRQFGQPIGDFQMVQKLIADSATEIFGVKMMVMNAAWEIDRGLEPRDKVSMIKVAASEMQGRVVDRAIQVFGGMGFSKDLPLERMYRDARVTRIYDGTSEIHRMLIARSTIKNGLQL